jgi:hypothetical protein
MRGELNRSANPIRLEPISPELALVDPALARAGLQRLTVLETADRVPWRQYPYAAPRAAAQPRRPWVIPLQILLAASLGANGFALARAVARQDAPAAASPAPSTSPPPGSRPTRRGALVEQKLLALVVQSPGGRLPAPLIDRNTGLPENNLQAACHSAHASSFLCVVRPAQATGAAAYVRYVPNRNGSGTFTWIRNPASASRQPAPEHPRQ